MAIIKIPSSNIYRTDSSSMLIAQNKIEQAEISVNDLNKENGNVLTKEYTITYWQEKEDGTGVDYVGDNSNLNEFIFTKTASLLGVTAAFMVSAPAKFRIGQIIEFQEDILGYVLGYTVVRKQHRMTVQSNGEDNIYWNRTVSSNSKILYDEDTNSFKYRLETDTINDNSVVVIATTLGGDVNYLMSETITIQGEYYSTKEILLKYGNSTLNDFSLPTNELVQQGNNIDGEELSNSVLQNVVRRYQNGKEAVTLKCSVGKYYDTDGNLVICPEDESYPAVIEKYDVVEPYVFTNRGEVPLSTKADGTAKQFQVIGVDFSYKGVVWQELTLQEYAT